MVHQSDGLILRGAARLGRQGFHTVEKGGGSCEIDIFLRLQSCSQSVVPLLKGDLLFDG